MSIQYDPSKKKWSVVKEKTDYKADRPTTIRTPTGWAPGYEYCSKYPGGQGAPAACSSPQATAYKETTLEELEKNLALYKKLDPATTGGTRQGIDNLISETQTKINTIKLAAELNKKDIETNLENEKKNIAYDKVLSIANTTQEGDYLKQKNQIKALTSNLDKDTADTIQDYYKTFYRTEKLNRWDPGLGKKPPYGEFDAEYYKTLNPALAEKWKEAVANDDIDITERYGERNFYWKDYTDVGAARGLRANRAEATQKANQYLETAPTDAELQQVRDKQLGMVDTDAQTELEEKFGTQIGEKAKEDLLKFGALRQNVLKDTIAEMKKAKLKEQELSLYKGLPGYGEIFDINKVLSDSILGDTGVGGVLSYMGKDPQESLTKQLQGVTGVNNNVVYNWQQWFDNALKDKYGKEVELGYTTTDGAEEKLKVDGEFAKSFIDTYLSPRFNTSKSMDEFVEYIDVKDEEQNPFQTQDAISAAKMTAEARAKAYLDGLKNESNRSFNTEFYFNPGNNNATDEANRLQAQEVAADWEAAKNGDPEWQKQAYRYGVDLNDKAAFARLHYQVKGQFKSFDPAEDFLTPKKVSDYIQNDILPAVSQEMLKQKTIFGQFITPQEFADSMLEGIDPSNKPTWDSVLKEYGLEGFNGSVEDLKTYIKDSIQSGTAKDIREQIAFLNKKKEKPTQELLGITYIERPSDLTATSITGETELYKTFQKAGFQGSEDEFYTRFFPDLDRTEQIALTKAGAGGKFEFQGMDLSDPISSLGSIESFFGSDDTKKATTKEEDESTSSYFRLGDEEDAEEAKSGQGFLDEFTSMFKGFG